jgi:hypothetical protein
MWDVIKTKIKCNICGDILTPKSNTEWVECSCGAVKVLGHGTFKAIKGKPENYQDLSTADLDIIPPHKGW